MAEKQVGLVIKPPNFKVARFTIKGTAPLVIHRFSHKTKTEMQHKMEAGGAGGKKRERNPKDFEADYNAARYISKDGWDGFHAAAIRCAMISACRLVNFKMTVAKLTVFVVADGSDAQEPQIPLVRIYGKPVLQMDMARVETGQPYIVARPAYHDWSAKLMIRWDDDQFHLEDVTNLLMRVGMQVGIGEGRPDSKNSAGMDWGRFELLKTEDKGGEA